MYRNNRRMGWFLVLLLVMSLALTGCNQEKEIVKETELSVGVATAEKGNIAKSVRYSGIVRGQNEVYIMPKAAARVAAIYVKPGDLVSAGQTIMALDTSDYEAGARQAEAAVNTAQFQLDLARTNLERVQKLHEMGANSAAELEQSEAAVSAAEMGLEQARAGLDRAGLDNCMITAPISGVVGTVNLSLGEMASPQTPAAIVSDTSQLEIDVTVSENEVSYIEPGSEVGVNIKAASSKLFKGIVDSVSAVPDPRKQNFVVKVVLDNSENLIKSGMFAEVSIDTISKDDVVRVPAIAVVPQGARTIVYTIDGDSRAQEREVTVGITNSAHVEIEKGLKAGEKVITKGNTLVSDGTLVRIAGGEK